MRLDGLKICITGGMGYVGSHTAKCLKAAGADVVVIDRRYVAQNLVEGVEYIKADYGDGDLWHEFTRNNSIDGIVHCAGTSLVGPSVLYPSEYYNNNVIKTVRMLDELKGCDRKPFIVFSSSAATYGNTTEMPITENTATIPCNPYGQTKLMIERILHDYDEAYGIKYFAFRYFNAAGADVWDSQLGPEPGDTHLIPRIFEAYNEKKVFKLFGTDYNTDDGTCLRDYIHVCDLAQAHLKACTELLNGSPSRTYNLGTGHGYTNQAIIDEFKRLVGDVEVKVEERREGDPDALVASAELFTKEQNMSPEFSDMETIIKSFKNFYNKAGIIK